MDCRYASPLKATHLRKETTGAGRVGRPGTTRLRLLPTHCTAAHFYSDFFNISISNLIMPSIIFLNRTLKRIGVKKSVEPVSISIELVNGDFLAVENGRKRKCFC